MTTILPLRLFAICLAVALTGAIVWAFTAADFWVSFNQILADPWGVVTLVDLYTGFALMSVIIVLVERARPLAFVLVLLTLVLGNVVTAVWFAWRLPRLLVLMQRG